jgi:ATP-dependent RNA helicase HelY
LFLTAGGNLGRTMAEPSLDPESPDPESPSPAEAYARFRKRQGSPLLAAFADSYPFAFDGYQLEACAQLEAGSGVLVAAPTGAGKTIVGEFAVFLALSNGRKCFYTTPIKALSNQKYADLVRRHGASNVGLLPGDTSVNSEAPIVVMTTEVLRNMIYARSSTLVNLGYVVLDEVHYLADRFRGAVWEEVIIGLADSIQLVALSATVSNAEEFGDWLSEVRGEMAVVVSERRPVPLYQHLLVGRTLHDLFAEVAPTARELPDEGKVDVNPILIKIARDESRFVRDDARRPRGKSGRGRRTMSYGSGAYGGRVRYGCRAARSWSSCSTTKTSCPRSCSSSPALAATLRSGSCSNPAYGSLQRPNGSRLPQSWSAMWPGSRVAICRHSTTTSSPRPSAGE